MAQIVLTTLSFISRGGITCRYCSRMVLIEDAQEFLIWDSGSSLKVEYSSGELLHLCGRQFEIYCSTCGVQAQIVVPPRGRRLRPRCIICGEEAKQRAVPSGSNPAK